MTKTYDEAIAQRDKLDAKLGEGQGAVKERKKLQAVIDAYEERLASKSTTEHKPGRQRRRKDKK